MIELYSGWQYPPWQVWPPTWGWLTSMASPMCWLSTRSGWWSQLDGSPSWRHGRWTYLITKYILHQSTSASRRKCSSTFSGRSTISTAFSAAGATAVQKVKQSNNKSITSNFIYLQATREILMWERRRGHTLGIRRTNWRLRRRNWGFILKVFHLIYEKCIH